MAGVDLADTGCFALEIAEVVEFCASDTATGDDFDLVDHGGVDGEGTLDADTVGVFADGERLADAAVLFGDADTLEKLDALFFAFADTDVDTEGIASAKRRDIAA